MSPRVRSLLLRWLAISAVTLGAVGVYLYPVRAIFTSTLRNDSPVVPTKRRPAQTPPEPSAAVSTAAVTIETETVGSGDPRPTLREKIAKVFGFGWLRRKPAPPKDKVAVLPARPARQFPPAVPDHLARRIDREIPVDLTAHISETGRIMSVQSLHTQDGLPAELTNCAIEAVRHWQFQPAKVGARYVPGDVTIHFRFSHSGAEWN